MSSPKILIASRQEPEVEAMLNDAPPEVEIHLLPPGEQLGDHLSNIEIIYGGIGEADFLKAESLRWVHQPHAGVEGFMYPAFEASDVVLTNCRRLYGQQISEHAFALLLSLTRSIPTQLEFMKRKHWERVPCIELAGMTMGILGLGGIGRAVAARAKAFEFNVIAVDPESIEKPDTVSRTWEVRLVTRIHGAIQRGDGLLSKHPRNT